MPNGFLCIVFCFIFIRTVISEKRLLLNDQDVMNNRLHKLESLVTVLNSSLAQVLSENRQLKQDQIKMQQDAQTQKQTISHMGTQIHTLETTLHNTQDHGAVYVRWGRKQCPNNSTEIVYSGYAGGGYYNEQGGGVEYVCLPPEPDFVKTSGNDYGRMYGAEFDSNFFAPNADNEDVPCALCRSTTATSVIMIPGKNSCYKGWKMEYHGYLTSGYYAQKRATSYACMDIQPEYIIGGVDVHNGALFYEVLAKCGSLKCPPYVNNYPLTCVVCTR